MRMITPRGLRVRRAEKPPGDHREDRIHKITCVGRLRSKYSGRSGGGTGTLLKGSLAERRSPNWRERTPTWRKRDLSSRLAELRRRLSAPKCLSLVPRTPQRNNNFSTGASFWPCFFFFINRKEKAKAAAQVTALPALPTLSSDCGQGERRKAR